MFEAIVNLFIAGIFLQAQAVTPATAIMPAETLILENHQSQASVPFKDLTKKSLGVKVTAKSFVVVEPKTGAVIYEKNSEENRSIASITKLMTALTFLDFNPGWDKEYIMTSSDFRAGAKPVLFPGEKVTVKDLFYAMMVASSNEAAIALVNSTGLSQEEFVKQMNFRAKLLGMNNSKFVEPSGLDSENKSTAKDLIKLIDVVFSHSEIRKAGGTKQYDLKIINKNESRTIYSTDKILKEDFGFKNQFYNLEAGKTGYLEAAGYCFVSQVSDQNNRKLLITVLGSSTTYDRFSDTKGLAYWVFNNFKW